MFSGSWRCIFDFPEPGAGSLNCGRIRLPWEVDKGTPAEAQEKQVGRGAESCHAWPLTKLNVTRFLARHYSIRRVWPCIPRSLDGLLLVRGKKFVVLSSFDFGDNGLLLGIERTFSALKDGYANFKRIQIPTAFRCGRKCRAPG